MDSTDGSLLPAAPEGIWRATANESRQAADECFDSPVWANGQSLTPPPNTTENGVMEETTTVGVWTTAIIAIGTAVVTLVSTKVVPALLKLRKDSREDREYRDHKTTDGYEVLIAEQNKRITTLETQLTEVQSEHLECIKVQERLKGANDKFSRELEILTEEVKGLRQWRHETANQLQTMVLKKDLGPDAK
jgi:hypothetical protein